MEDVAKTVDYKKSITVNVKPEDVYGALTNRMKEWWTENIDGVYGKAGDVFTVHFGSTHKTFMVEKAVPNESVIWFCQDAYIDLPELKNKSEWNGTRVIWDMRPKGSGTEITVTHIGLTPEVECYQICEAGWTFYLSVSLNYLLTTRKGKPYKD